MTNEEAITFLTDTKTEHERLYMKFLNLQHEDPDYVLAFQVAVKNWSGKIDGLDRKLKELGVGVDTPELQEQ